MLEHPWLTMADDYDFRMSDLEYRKYKLRQTVEAGSQEILREEYQGPKKKSEATLGPFECCVSELAEVESDINAGDNEDNESLDSD